MMPKEVDLAALRREIDGINSLMVELFERRMRVVAAVAAYKKAHKLPVRDKAREDAVVRACAAKVRNSELKAACERVMRCIIAEAVAHETLLTKPRLRKNARLVRMRRERAGSLVGYMGVAGSYGHVAMQQFFAGASYEEMAFTLHAELVNALVEGRVQYAVLPLENSSTGGITEVYELLRKCPVHIVGEESVKVEQCLMAYPGAKMANIRRVYSHPQGFAQCADFFHAHPEMELVSYPNTAQAAELVRKSGDLSLAAVAGRQAAALYGLEILAPEINMDTNNYTRFVILSREEERSEEANKITIVVTLSHEPGALYKMLGIFQQAGLNLLGIESRPLAHRPWEYCFHIDVEGNLADMKVQETLVQVAEEASEYKVLGNYRRAL